MDARTLIETLQRRGLTISAKGDKVRVEASQEPDAETKAMIEELRQHKEEVKSVLTQDPPPPCWNCGQPMTETTDIYGTAWWACWACAKWT